MAHEFFEDFETANFLNTHFINIKVDREENPEIDSYLQDACQFYSGQGGWPLSAFLLPENFAPFFAGTYFPKTNQQGHPSFLGLLKELQSAYTSQRHLLEKNAENFLQEFKESSKRVHPQDEQLPKHLVPSANILQAIAVIEDKEDGGYGNPPKFPHFSFLEWGVEQSIEGQIDLTSSEGKHLLFSLKRMITGGIVDQIRGGIHRYCVEKTWLIPHFEKMLYDQAGLMKLLAKASLISNEPIFPYHLSTLLDYLETEMLSEQNYFFSSQDADSEGEEGLFYTFTEEEVEQSLLANSSLNKEQIESCKKYLGITKQGNFEQGLTVLSLKQDFWSEIFSENSFSAELQECFKSLLKTRSTRIPPMTDTKGIASWNFLTLLGLCDIIQHCPYLSLVNHAQGLLEKTLSGVFSTFLKQVPEHPEKSFILHSTSVEKSVLYFEDYCFFSELQLRLYELFGLEQFLENFKQNLRFLIENFVETSTLEFFTTHYSLGIPRVPSTFFDSSYRSPASTFLNLCKKAAILFSEEYYANLYEKFFEKANREALRYPVGHGELLRTLSSPLESFILLKIPKEWKQEEKFLQLRRLFFSRVAILYNQEENTTAWEICRYQRCEKNGEGLDSLIDTLSGQ